MLDVFGTEYANRLSVVRVLHGLCYETALLKVDIAGHGRAGGDIRD